MDRTQILSIAGAYDLPVGRGRMLPSNPSRPPGILINDWTLGEVFNAQSGFPVSLDTCFRTEVREHVFSSRVNLC